MDLTKEAFEEAKQRGELRYGNPLSDDCCYAGFHPFHTEDCPTPNQPDCTGEGQGSFEVFYRAPSIWRGEGAHASEEEEHLKPGSFGGPAFLVTLPQPQVHRVGLSRR